MKNQRFCRPPGLSWIYALTGGLRPRLLPVAALRLIQQKTTAGKLHPGSFETVSPAGTGSRFPAVPPCRIRDNLHRIKLYKVPAGGWDLLRRPAPTDLFMRHGMRYGRIRVRQSRAFTTPCCPCFWEDLPDKARSLFMPFYYQPLKNAVTFRACLCCNKFTSIGKKPP